METNIKIIVGNMFKILVKKESGQTTLEVPQKLYDFITDLKDGDERELSPTTLLSGGANILSMLSIMKGIKK